MTQLDKPSEQPDTPNKPFAAPPKEKGISAKENGSSEPAPVPEPPWGDAADHLSGSDWLE